MAEGDCLFCKLVKRDVNSWNVYDDDKYIAFLTPFPSIEGSIIVIPKEHVAEEIWQLDSEKRRELLDVVKKVADRMKEVLKVHKVALIFEGEAVPHVHAKLFPMHDLRDNIKPKDGYYGKYPGFLDTRGGPKMDDKKLDELRDKLKF